MPFRSAARDGTLSLKQSYWRAREYFIHAIRKYVLVLRDIVCEPYRLARDLYDQCKLLVLVCTLPRTAVSKSRGTLQTPSLLLVSYFSPPYRSNFGTQRINKFLKYLRREGWHITMITTAPDASELDIAAELQPEGVEVIRIARQLRRSKFITRGWFVPDDHFRWAMLAASTAFQVAKTRDFSIVLGTVPPYSNLLAAALSAHAIQCPLVADFRDPWSKIDIAWTLHNRLSQRLTEYMERKLLVCCAKVILTLEDDRFIDDYLVDVSPDVRSKLACISNGYDDEDFIGVDSSPRDDFFTVSYVGSIYDQEAFDALIAPFRLWGEQSPCELERVRFDYAGGSTHFFKTTKTSAFNFFDHGYLTHREAIALRAKSHVQLFSQPPHFSRHVFSGKIFEMLRTGPPILAITRPDGVVAELITTAKAGRAVPHNTPQAATDYLRDRYREWLSGRALDGPLQNVVKRYSRANLALRFDTALRELL